MSKKDQLGGGRFGSAQTRPVSARRQAVAEATGVPTTAAPDSRLRTLPLEQLVPTRFNPRRNFGTSEDLKDFGLKLKTKQLQPAVAVTREAYLKLWENEADAVGTHRYVIANGERRYRASQAAGLETLEVIVDDTIAASRATFLDAVLSENNDREDLDPVEQAIGIQTMVDQLGGKAKVAEHYGKSAGWVTQQLYLLKLAPELQELVSAGTLPVRETRDLVKLPVGEQATAWEARLAARVQEKPKPKPIEHTHAPQEQPHPAASETTGFTAVKPPEDRPTEPAHASPPEPSVFTAVKTEAEVPDQSESRGNSEPPAPTQANTPPDNVPEPRHSAVAAEVKPSEEKLKQGKPLPYDNGPFIAMHLGRMMDETAHAATASIMNKHVWDKAGAAKALDLLREMLEMAEQKDQEQLHTLLKDFARPTEHAS